VMCIRDWYARADDGTPRGAVFVPFCYYEAAINRLTNAALDPFAKIPDFKYCAIQVTVGGEVAEQGSYGGGQALRGADADPAEAKRAGFDTLLSK
jgi:formate dehydrogenase major subunit